MGLFSFGTGSSLPYAPSSSGPKYPYYLTVTLGATPVYSFLCETYGLAEAQAILVAEQIKTSANIMELRKNGNVIKTWKRSLDQWFEL